MQNKNFRKEILRLMLPIAFQNLMTTLVSATDALVLARVDQYSMASVSLAAEISFISSVFVGTVIIALSILAAQYKGKGDSRSVENLMGMALRYNLLISLVFFAGARFFPEGLMSIYTSDSLLLKVGTDYLKIASWSYLLSAVSQCYLCIMKLSGGARMTAVIAGITALMDVLVDVVLVYHFHMGANGTACSTVVVSLIELIGVIQYSHRKNRTHPTAGNLLYHSPELSGDFRKVGFPVLIGYLVWGLGYSLSSAVMGHISADASSAYAVASVILNLFSCFIHGMGRGAAILIGKTLGGGNMEEAKQSGAWILNASLICGIFSALLLCMLGPLTLRFYILNDLTKTYLRQMLPIGAIYLLAQSVCVIMNDGVFSAGGDTKFDTQTTAFSMWVISLPLGCLAAFVLHMPVVAVYLALSLYQVLKAFFVYPRFRKYYWLKDLTRNF